MKVVLTHKEGYALGVISAVMAVALIVVCCFELTAINFLVSALCCALCVFGFCLAACTEILDNTGITLKSPFRIQQFQWKQICRVEVAKPSGKDTAKLELFPKDRKQPICIDYTKQSLKCVRLYYGEPDADHYGKEPQHY